VREENNLSDIATNIAQIRDRIARACARAARSVHSVQLMAVSKMHPAHVLLEAAQQGIVLFGENRVQEVMAKRPELATLPPACKVAMIGHLQTNKAKRAVEVCDAVHSLDSLELAERLNTAAQSLGRKLPVLLEIKLSHEATKTGLLPDSIALTQLLERLPNLEALEVRGLMTVPPWDEDPEAPRPYFVQLRELRNTLARQHPSLDFSELSMGMTNDFATAIEEGATIVRIGTAIFGARQRL
jgi:pyridoxal phosphate enzyme (YggS family)